MRIKACKHSKKSGKSRHHNQRYHKQKGSGPKYWMLAMGTAGAMFLSTPPSKRIVLARGRISIPSTSDTTKSNQSLTVYHFDIPAGPLSAVLPAFEKITGFQVVVPEAGINDLPSNGVSGVYSVEEALKQILAETAVSYAFTNSRTVTLQIRASGETVNITAGESVTIQKYAGTLVDTPQSINVVDSHVMEEQGVTTLRDALRNVAGISLAAGEAGAQGDNLTVRGFTARNDLFIDGMRDFGSYYRDPFNTQDVEVLEGPSSVTFGRGSTGGVVNQASKSPGLDKFISGNTSFGSDTTRRGNVDLNLPVPALGQNTAFRLNVMGDEGNVADRDISENRRWGIAPSLAFGLGTATRLTFSYFHQTADDIPDYGLPWLFNAPAPVDRSNYYGFQDGSYLRTVDDIGTARLEHDFNSSITMREQVRYANYVRDVRVTEGQIISPSLSTPLDQLRVDRRQIAVSSVETFFDDQVDATFTFRTGPIRHTLVTGIELSRETSDPTRFTYTGVPSTSLVRPTPLDPFIGTATATSQVQTTALSFGAYAIDTAELSKRWLVTGGARWDLFDVNYEQTVKPASAFTRVDRMTSWRGALVFKPVPVGSVYFDYGTSFNPSAESLSLTAGSANLPPEENRTFEVGSKWDLRHGKLNLAGAVFRTDKTNARETSPTNSLLTVLAGNQRVTGFQVETRGRITSRWEMLASYAYLDSKVVSSRFFPLAVGLPLGNVPKNTFNFWTSYSFPKNWEVGGGGNYVSSRTASSTAPFDPITGLIKEAPGYWVFNAMAKHRLNEHFELQVNANNLTNKFYFDLIHPAHIVPGAGRSVLCGLNFKF